MEISTDVWKDCGISAAAVYSVIKAKCEEKSVPIKGHSYTCLPVSEIHRACPLITTRTITRVLTSLEDKGYIESITFFGTAKWRRILK
jgi:DNA-binding MarR family transcriptional regulator